MAVVHVVFAILARVSTGILNPIRGLPNFSDGLPRELHAAEDGYASSYRSWMAMEIPNKDVPVLADAPAFRKKHHKLSRIFFVHNNKCGGSSICYLAQVNGEKTGVDPDEWGCENRDCRRGYFDENYDDSCLATATFIETQGIDPKELLELKNNSDAILITIVRDPVSRLVSEWRHYGYRWDEHLRDGTLREDWQGPATLSRRDDMDAMIDYHSTHDPSEIRWNVGAATQDDAKEAFRLYDFVLVMEDFDSTDLVRLRKIGWTSLLADDAHQNVVPDAAPELSKTQRERLQELFAGEIAMYKAAVQVAKKQRLAQLL